MAKLRAIFQAGLGAWASLMRRISAPVRVVVSVSVTDRVATSSPVAAGVARAAVAAWAAGVARMSPAEAAARTMAMRDRGLSFHAADRVS
ncbi:hypothetical protein [Nonomuraea rubra]|uniref:Uncharacterized protein n=1 Tax=Nonomuraea rubra TaxID=46180 RepID=A0A7X0TWN4_9ACTN|nr:hypothetical protein [Nonomuraea rubra]MBB6546523.1 hypothetical protein [Nonomuraea rubra]